MNRRGFILGLFGLAPVAAATAVTKEAEASPSSINDFYRSQVWPDEGWERVPEARYVTSVREIWKMDYVGEPIKWTADD
jgi:hypothetical protein